MNIVSGGQLTKNKNGKKLKKDFTSGTDQISKYKKIIEENFIPGRPGEEYYEITTSDGKKTQLSRDQKSKLNKLKK